MNFGVVMKHTRNLLRSPVAAAIAIAFTHLAYAQQSEPVQTAEPVLVDVTSQGYDVRTSQSATKTNTPLIETPVTVNSVSQELIIDKQVLSRVTQALGKTLKNHEGKTVVMVAHDSVNRVMLLHMLGLPLSKYWAIKQDPCCINEIDFNEGVFQINSINETWHLHEIDG